MTASSSASSTASVRTFRAELRSDAPWVTTPAPRLSWTVSAPGDWQQTWAEVAADDDLVRISNGESRLVAWPFEPLAPGEERRIRVRAASADGRVTAWSAPLSVVNIRITGWTAQLIGIAEPPAVARPARLRHVFSVRKPVRRALLHTTALGAAEWFVNGTRTDDAVLSPGWTSYELRMRYDTADVTELIGTGPITLSVRLAGAWFTEEYHVLTPPKRFHGEQPRVAAELHVEYEDGTREVIVTDDTWRGVPDPVILSSGIYAGERIDAREEIDGWQRADFDDSAWPATTTEPLSLTPEPREDQPVRELETLPVQEVLRAESSRIMLDFGQNLVGRLRLRVRGPRGARITLRHAEVLDGDDLALRPLRRAAATDEIVLAGTGEETHEPTFTFHGFRYAQIEGWPGEFDPNAVEAVVLQSDFPRTGWFSCSDPLLQRFHENVVWTLRGNYLAVPMDCPQRDERLGWTGDTQLFAPTARFLYDCDAFLRSWLRDLRLEQRRNDGIVPLFAPAVVQPFADRGPIAAWGDAIVIVPDVLYRFGGDETLLSECFTAMCDWLAAVERALDADGLWTSGRQLGDWLDPAAPPNAPARGRTDTDIVATAYLVRSAMLTARIARRLGRTHEAEAFDSLANRTRIAFRDAFVSPAGRMVSDSQTAYALAIAFDIVEDEPLRSRIAERLANIVRRDGYKVGAGIVGSAVVLEALTISGYVEVAERLMFQTDAPSWLYPVKTGATTVWERWDGLLEDGSLNPGAMISFNHVAFGSAANWLHERVAGLSALEPGYRRILIAPYPVSRLTYASARHESPYGLIESGWSRTPNHLEVHATIPPNSTAEVRLPDGRVLEAGSGHHRWRCALPDAQHPPTLTLESSMAELAQYEPALRAVHGALGRSPNPFVARAIRQGAQYRPTLTIRDALIFVSPETLAEVETALADTTSAAHSTRSQENP